MDGIQEHMQLVEPLRNPTLISGIMINRRAGRLPGRTLSHLIDVWGAKLLASIDAEELYDLSVIRPQVRYEGDVRKTDWPEIQVFLARHDDIERDFLLLLGHEPSFRWQGFVGMLMPYLDSLGLKTMVTLRAFPGEVPHTRPSMIRVRGADPALPARFGGRAPEQRYEGPTDIGAVLAAKAESLGWQTIDLTVLQPYYFPRMPNIQANMDLITALDRGFGTTTSVESMREAARRQLQAIDASMNDSDEMQQTLRDLEQKYDAGAPDATTGESLGEGSQGLPSSDEILKEIERLFGGATDESPRD